MCDVLQVCSWVTGIDTWGGKVTSVSATEDKDDALVERGRYNLILLSSEALNEYVVTQVRCDLVNAPVWTEAGYAMCSDVTRDTEA